MMGNKISLILYFGRQQFECDKTCQTLPRVPESSGIILLKLKCKLQFRGHEYCQAVCPHLAGS